MKNLSFWNQIAGAKGKAVVCTAAAASLAVLLFVVCSNNSTNPPPPPPPGTADNCRFWANPAECEPVGSANRFGAIDAAACATLGGAIVTSCTASPTPTECNAYPDATGCGATGACLNNPTPDCPNYCQFYPNAAQCQPDNCTSNPTAPGCQPQNNGYCRFWANSAECELVGSTNRFGATDAAACATLGGTIVTSCTAAPTTAECNAYPTAAGCGGDPNTDPCAGGASTACCNATNHSFEGCNPCNAIPTPASCGGGDPCVTNPTITPGCPGYNVCFAEGATPACCAANPSYQGCQPTGNKQYCYWGVGECYPIDNPNDIDPGATGGLTYLQNCQQNGFVSSSSTCADAPTEEFYCYWDDADGTGCVRIPQPDAEDPKNPGKTNKQVCELYGFLTTSSTCADYVKPAIEYYCYWTDPTAGCFKISDPSGPSSDNPGKTNLEVCELYSLPGKAYTTSTCDGYTPPAVTYYCDWGPYNPNATVEADKKGCWPTTEGNADCIAYGKMVTCTKGNAPANGAGSCCAQ